MLQISKRKWKRRGGSGKEEKGVDKNNKHGKGILSPQKKHFNAEYLPLLASWLASALFCVFLCIGVYLMRRMVSERKQRSLHKLCLISSDYSYFRSPLKSSSEGSYIGFSQFIPHACNATVSDELSQDKNIKRFNTYSKFSNGLK